MQPLGVASCTRGHATLQTLPTHMNAPMYAQFSMNRIVVAMTMMGSVTCHRKDSYQNRKMYCDGDGRGTKRALNGLEAMLRWSSTARSEHKEHRQPQRKGPKGAFHPMMERSDQCSDHPLLAPRGTRSHARSRASGPGRRGRDGLPLSV